MAHAIRTIQAWVGTLRLALSVPINTSTSAPDGKQLRDATHPVGQLPTVG